MNYEDLKEKCELLEIHIRHLKNDYQLTKEENEKSVAKYIELLSELSEKNDILQDLQKNLERQVEKRTKKLNESKRFIQQKSEELQIMLDSSPIMIFYKNKSNKFVRVNKSFASFVDSTIDEIVGKSDYDLFPDSAEQHHKDDLEIIETGKPKLNIVESIKTPSGTKWLKIDRIPYENTGIIGFAEDITYRLKTEEKLFEQKQFLENVLESITHPFHVINVKDFSIEIANSASKFNSGRKADKCYELTHNRPEPCDKSTCPVEIIKNTLKPVSIENTYFDKNGKARYVEVQGFPVFDQEGNLTQIIESLIDRTEKKEAEKALKISEERYRDIVEKAGIAITTTDIKGRITYFNENASTLFGYRPFEMKNQSIETLTHPEDVKVVTKNHKQRIRGKNVPSRYEFRGIRKNGDIIHLEVDVVKIYESEIIVGTRTYIWDVTNRKRIDAAIKESEERYRVLVESADDIIFTINSDGEFLSVNRKLSRILRKKPGKIIGRSIFDFFPREKAQTQMKEIDKIFKSGKKGSNTKQIETMIGEHWYSTSLTPIKDVQDNTMYLMGISRDITEQHKTEEALGKYSVILEEMVRQQTDDLTRTQNELKAFLDNLPDSAWIKDKELKYVIVNQAFAKFYGQTAKEISGKSDMDIISKENAKRYHSLDRKVLRTGKSFRIEETFVTIFGEKVILEIVKNPFRDTEGNTIGVVGIARDITERKRFENAIKDSEERFRQFFENEPGYCYIISPEGKILNSNMAAAKAMGYSKSELNGKYLLSLYSPESKSGLDELMNRNESGNDKIEIHKANIITKSGEKRTVIVNISPVKDESDNLMYYVFVQEDITERLKAEDALNIATKRLHQSERLAATGRLSASIAHEINNPLQAISHSITFLENALSENFEEKESLEQIKIGINRITHTVKQLLDIHRAKVDVKEKVNVNSIIESTLDLLKHQLKVNKIKVETSFCKTKPVIHAYTQEMFQVFLNLFLNAQDAMENGGLLKIYTAIRKNDVHVMIKDNGTGITPKEREHIFEPFYTTKQKKLGTGLGLSTVKGIVESFRGEIQVKSKPKHGATFNIIFPLSE